MNNFGEKVSFIWSVADLLRDAFKRSKYPDVILPLTVLRRLDCVLEPTKDKVLAQHSKLKGKLTNLAPQLSRASGFAFYNTSPFNFEKLLGDAPHLANNLRSYINGFSDNMREVIEKFDFDNTINKLNDSGLLFLVLERFKNIDLHPDVVSNLEMGYIFEELIRKFNEAMDENPGEHFTPREVIRLMVNLLLSRDKDALKQNHIVRTVFDPCCGSGGMLTIAKDRIVEINPNADVHLFGQEVNPETFAVCKSDLYMKTPDGRDAESIKFGSTLGNDQHSDKRFDYLLTNPPFGKEWKIDQSKVEDEASRGHAGRFGAGLPRISDGQLLFLQHLLSRMKDKDEGGSRVAIVMNGSPLFTGDAGSGESEIRRWILERDWLEAIIALPEQLFYNTGIPTYVWVLTNRKPPKRRNKVQLIDATGCWTSMRRSLGDKRREISPEQIGEITKTFEGFKANGNSKIFATEDFGYRKITVERPLRLNFQASPERIDRLNLERAFQSLATSKKKGKAAEAEIEAGRKQQATLLKLLKKLDSSMIRGNRNEFCEELDKVLESFDGKVPAPLRKAILSALSERDETADICTDDEGQPEADPELRDTENVPLTEDVNEFFGREVKPHVPDAWINTAVCDPRDGKIGRVGYEINVNRCFHLYRPPRPLENIAHDLATLETQIVGMLRQVIGSIGDGVSEKVKVESRSFRKHSAYKPSGVDWIGDIPSHWSVARIRYVARLESGHTPSRQHPEYWLNCHIPWFTLSDVWQLRDGCKKYVDDTAEKISDLGLANSAARLLPANTVILSRTASVGYTGILRRSMATSQDFVNWICGPRLCPEFLWNVFRGMRQEFDRQMMGSTHKTIYMPQVQAFATPIPPMSEQEAIVSFIDRETSVIEAMTTGFPSSSSGDGTLVALAALLSEYRNALISAAVTGKIDVRSAAVDRKATA